MKLIILILFCLSCGDDNFKKVEKVESFRILGIKADFPEVSPGTSVNLLPIISDVNGESQVISGSYEACIDPGISRGATVSCDHDTSKVEDEYDIVIANLTPNADGRSGFSDPLSITIPNSILLGRSDREKFNGVGYIVIFRFIVNDVEYKSFKRIIATTRNTLNSNPVADDILINGSVHSKAPSNGDVLKLKISNAPESYSVINVDGKLENRKESYQIAWYTDKGSFNLSKVLIDEPVEFEGSEANNLTMAIVRDGRGGVDLIKIHYP